MNEFLHGTAVFLLYVISAAGISFLARGFLKIPDELFRKILHFILLGAYIPMLFVFETWWKAALLAAGLIVIFYPVILLAEKLPAFSSFINQRRSGEIKNSMILALSVMAFSILVCWGLFGDRYLVLACVYAWGVGDAFAALVGKRFGRHKIHMKFADHNKSVEGSAAMFASSALSVCAVLLVRGGLGIISCVFIALVSAAASTFAELCTKDGYDTFTCPAVAMAVILPLIKILGG